MCAAVANDTQSGVDVCLDEDVVMKAPHCPHGPTLLFQRFVPGKPTPQQYYACSACRDRKDCGFFQLYADAEIISQTKQLIREEYNRSRQPWQKQEEFYERLKCTEQVADHDRRFCYDCQLLLLPTEPAGRHETHRVKTGITTNELKQPSYLMDAIDNNKTNAQYLFSARSVKFLVHTLQSLGFNRILCIGVPRLHEYVCANASLGLDSLLLDIDHRYGQFYPPSQFCRYNMFNHFFLDGAQSQKNCRDFLARSKGGGVVMVTDPPFGGLVDVLASGVRWIMNLWKTVASDSGKELAVMWVFPYFMEHRITESMVGFQMLDYKVDYDNHPLFKGGALARSKGSPVRIFTNIGPARIKLPSSEGYRFCLICRRYVARENLHCAQCNECPSKNGTTYRHCQACKKCVKPSFAHCAKCNRCDLPTHSCDRTPRGCHLCGALDHKRRDCPKRTASLKRSLQKMESSETSKARTWPKRKKKPSIIPLSEICFGPAEELEPVASPAPLVEGPSSLTNTSGSVICQNEFGLHKEAGSSRECVEGSQSSEGGSVPLAGRDDSCDASGSGEQHQMQDERPHVFGDAQPVQLLDAEETGQEVSGGPASSGENAMPTRQKRSIMGKTLRLMDRIQKMRMKRKIRLKP